MSEGIASYVNQNFEKYISEKSLKEGILNQNPRQENLVQAKKLDDYLQTLMKEKKKSNESQFDTLLEKVQNKNLDVMGPLGKLWQAVDNVTSYKGEGTPPTLSIENAQQLIEQSVMLLGQTNNLLQYERRKNVLNSVMGTNLGLSTLKEQNDLIGKSDSLLFGDNFRDRIINSSKAKRKSIEAFSSDQPPVKKPFRTDPSYQSRRQFGDRRRAIIQVHQHKWRKLTVQQQQRWLPRKTE